MVPGLGHGFRACMVSGLEAWWQGGYWLGHGERGDKVIPSSEKVTEKVYTGGSR